VSIIKSLESIMGLEFGLKKKQSKSKKQIAISDPGRCQMLQIPKSSQLFDYMSAILNHASGEVANPFRYYAFESATVSFYNFEMFKRGIELLTAINKENWQLTGTTADMLAIITFSEDYPVMLALINSADKKIVASWALAPRVDIENDDELRKKIGAELFKKGGKRKKKEEVKQ
jgi:hypothetical protein